MKTKLKRIVYGLILGPLAPLAFFMGAWWCACLYFPEDWIPFLAIAGLLLGILFDFLALPRLLNRARELGMVFWTAVFLFYSAGFFGLFMGVPAFNTILAIPAGIVIGVKLAAENAPPARVRLVSRWAASCTAGILALFCAASALLALADSFTAANLKGMLGLSFDVSQGMLIGLIAVGGVFSLAIDWWLTTMTTRFSCSFFRQA